MLVVQRVGIQEVGLEKRNGLELRSEVRCRQNLVLMNPRSSRVERLQAPREAPLEAWPQSLVRVHQIDDVPMTVTLHVSNNGRVQRGRGVE